MKVNKQSLQRYLLWRLGLIVLCLTVLLAGLLAYLLFYSHDDSAEYYMQYEALTLSEHYKTDDQIIEFDPQVKEYYWRQSQLPDSLQQMISEHGVSVDKLNWLQNSRYDIYIYPHTLDDNQTFWVVHYLTRDDLGEGFYFSRNLAVIFTCIFIALLLVTIVMLSLGISAQLQRFTVWVSDIQQSDDDNLLDAPEFTFAELQQAAFLLAKSISAERQLQREQQQQVKREKAFLSTLSHELRTPMAVINAAIAVLHKRNDLNHKDVTTLNKLATANDKMKLLSNVLLALWRKQHNHTEPQSINVGELLDQAITAVQQQSSLSVNVTTPNGCDDWQQLNITAHQALLQLVLDNLLRNAAQYSADNSANVELVIEDDQLKQLKVSNLAANQAEPQSPVGEDYGFGLGLYLVAEICQQQSWDWTTESVGEHFVVAVYF